MLEFILMAILHCTFAACGGEFRW